MHIQRPANTTKDKEKAAFCQIAFSYESFTTFYEGQKLVDIGNEELSLLYRIRFAVVF